MFLLCGAGLSAVAAHAQKKVIIEDESPKGVVLVTIDKAGDEIIRIMNESQLPYIHEPQAPRFLLTDRKGKFALGIGGYVRATAEYDFGGIVDNIDFIPAYIPGGSKIKNQFQMDASTSTIFLKLVGHTKILGDFIVYTAGNFRDGSNKGFQLRNAYVSFRDVTVGYTYGGFMDLGALPSTIDFQGPNAYNFNFATMIRYEYAFADNHLKFGVAAEMPSVSGTYNDNFATLKQRVPDFPAYFQYAWGANRDSHIRASGVVRNMYLHNLRTGNNTSLLGWGVQFSGTIKVAQPLRLFMNGVYGKGVTPYIQDLTGSGLDFTPNPENADQIQTMPMWGWQAAAQINLTPRLFISGGYSTVRVQRSHGFYSDDQYKQGQYIFGNIFYSITPRCKVAGEYLYGSRKDMSNDKGHANRVNVMLQYSF